MEQFNLDSWLKDKSRKVVTRRGNPVRIICWDRKHGEDDLPIVFLEECNGGEFLLTCKSNGRDGSSKDYDTPYDLFFEEEELTEFEKELEMMMVSFSNGNLSSDVRKEMPKQKLYNYAHRLLDLARKELEKSIEDGAIEFAKSYMEDVNPSFEKVQESEELWKWKMSCLKGVNKAYTNGKQDALKESPKWKKCDDNLPYSHIGGLNNRYLIKDGYCIKISDLETLPKEE